MYGPKWPFLLRYGSRDTRHIDFPCVDGLSMDTLGVERHTYITPSQEVCDSSSPQSHSIEEYHALYTPQSHYVEEYHALYTEHQCHIPEGTSQIV